MNINDGRNYFPSSSTENLVERLLINRHNPGTLQVQQQSAEVIGDNKVSVLNQAVQGGVNVMNLQVNGPIRSKEPVPARNRVLTKYENKRRSSENQEALYNIRQADDRFIYGHYLDQQLADKAKQKVFNKPSINFREQVKETTLFEGFKTGFSADSLKSMAGMTTFDLDFKDANESGVLRFNQDNIGALGISNTQAASMSPGSNYNPLLLTSPLNKYDQRYAPGTPDERINFYTGERAYVSKGERQLQAREMATSEYAKERRALQQMANDAANKTPHNPRAGVAEFKRGFLNVQPYVTETFAEEQAGRHDVNENFVDRVNLTTDRGFDHMRDIQQAVELEDSPAIAEIKSDQFNQNVIRKIHSDNGDAKLFGTTGSKPVGLSTGLGGLYETFVNLYTKDALLKDVVQGTLSTKDRKTKEYKNETFQTHVTENLSANSFGLESTSETSDSRYLAKKNYKTNLSSYGDISKDKDISYKFKESFETVKEMSDARADAKKDFKNQTLAQKIFSSIKSGLGLETTEDKEDFRYDNTVKVGYTRRVFEDQQLRDRLKELEVRNNDFDVKTGKYTVFENGRHKDFSSSSTLATEIIEPMSLLETSDGTVIRTVVVKENDVCKIIQVRKSGDFKEYVTGAMPTEMLEGILGHGLKTLDDSNSRFNNLVGLNAHDHVAINIILEEMPEKLKLESTRPLNIYQRDLLDTTLPKIGCITETKVIVEQLNEDHRGDAISAKQITSGRTEHLETTQRIIQTQTLKEDRQQVSRDWQKQNFAKDTNPAKYTARFNDL